MDSFLGLVKLFNGPSPGKLFERVIIISLLFASKKRNDDEPDPRAQTVDPTSHLKGQNFIKI